MAKKARIRTHKAPQRGWPSSGFCPFSDLNELWYSTHAVKNPNITHLISVSPFVQVHFVSVFCISKQNTRKKKYVLTVSAYSIQVISVRMEKIKQK